MTRHFTIAVLLGTLSCGQAPQEEALDEPVVEPAAPAVRRLTAPQYERVVTDLFGEGLVMPTSLEPDVAFEGLQSIGASTTSLSSGVWSGTRTRPTCLRNKPSQTPLGEPLMFRAGWAR